MKHIDDNWFDEVTLEDVDAYYPQALFFALILLLPKRKSNPQRDPLWEPFCAYLDRVSDRVLGRNAHLIESHVKSFAILQRIQLDGVTPLFVDNWVEESASVPSEKRKYRLQIRCPSEPRVLQLALWLKLDAILSGKCQCPVDRNGLSGEGLALLNEAEELVPRISVKMQNDLLLH